MKFPAVDSYPGAASAVISAPVSSLLTLCVTRLMAAFAARPETRTESAAAFARSIWCLLSHSLRALSVALHAHGVIYEFRDNNEPKTGTGYSRLPRRRDPIRARPIGRHDLSHAG